MSYRNHADSVLAHLANGEQHAAGIAFALDISRSTVDKCLILLEAQGRVTSGKKRISPKGPRTTVWAAAPPPHNPMHQ